MYLNEWILVNGRYKTLNLFLPANGGYCYVMVK